jgi:hypothetical protein
VLISAGRYYTDFPPFCGIAYPTIPARWAKPKDK